MKYTKRQCLLILVLITVILTLTTSSAADESNQTTPIIESSNSMTTSDFNHENITEIPHKQYDKTLKKSEDYIYVSSNSSETSSGTSINQPTTLTKAIDEAESNQVILLVSNDKQDTYKFTQQIYLNSNQNEFLNLTIMGQNGKTITFDGQNKTGLFNLRYASLTLKNIVITNIDYYSSAIYAYNSNITLINCTINNKSPSNSNLIGAYSSNLVINNTIIENNQVKGSNPIIYVSDGKLTVDNSILQNNTLENRAIISTLNSENLLINSQFNNNTSQKTAPVLYAKNSDNNIKNSKFNNNHGNESGATYFLESDTYIQNSQFVNNTAQQLGGAITQLGNKVLDITKSTFTNNNAQYDGGSVYSIQSNVLITSSTFTNNKARNGGALYLADNVNDILIQVSDNTFTNNQATKEGDAIWSNHDININNNVFYSTRNRNWIKLEQSKDNDINENWWSVNAPNFNVITDGIVPESWRLMTVTNKTSANTQQITVSLNNLSNGSQTTKTLPSRNAKFTADNGNFTKTSLSITGSVTNIYTGSSTNVKVKIDNQEVKIYTKRDAYLSINNVTTNKAGQVTFIINSNREINSTVTLKVNGVTLTSQLTKGYTTIKYTIPTTWKTNNYTTTLTMTSTSKYAAKSINGYLLLKDNNITISTINSTDLKLLTSTLPSAYDLRNQSLVSSVKTQGSSGSCWAFSSLASLESVLLRKTGIEYDFSENNMKNLLKKYSTIGDNGGEPNSGNNDFEPISFLTGWYGPVLESEDPYDPSSILSPLLDPAFHIQDVYIIPERKNATDNQLIKQAIYNYGAVSTGIYLSGKNTYNTERSVNHGVVIVGWDDNYSKTNFSPNPPGNGAFIVKNSWGPNSGDNGYYYVSYYDTTIGSLCNSNDTENEQLNYVILMENTDNYTNVYQHDSIVNALSTYSDFVAYKNIYTATKDENIAAFGTYFMQKSDYQVEIWVNGKRVHTQKDTVTLPGYRTIKLNKYVLVNKGDEFEIIVKINRTKTGHNYILVQYSDLYHAPIREGQSFLEFDSDDGQWLDLYEYECVAPLKVYTKDVPTINNTFTYENNKITITTKISNVKTDGTLNYYLNGEAIKINNKTVTYTINKDSTITFNLADDTNEKYKNITAEYISENYKITENKTVENTKLKETNITLTTNKTAYIGDNLILSGKLTSQTALANAIINIKINNEEFNVTTDKNGKYQLSYTVKKSGENRVTVLYQGNQSYASANTEVTFTADKKHTRILLYTKSPLDVSTTTRISGKLLYGNEGIKGETVNITVNSNKYTAKTDVYGYFTINYTVRTYDDINVVYTYSGNSYYKSSNNTITYTVKRPTELFIYTIYNTNYGKSIKISGKLLSNGSAVTGETVKITVNNNQTFTATSGGYGYFTINYKVNSYKNHSVLITYDGRNNYMASTNSTTFVVKQPTTLFMYSRSNDKIGSTIKVSGKLLSNGVGLKGLTVNITINGKKYSAKTVGYGYFTINYTINAYDDLNITYRYAGNSLFESCTNKTVYTILKPVLFMYSRSGDKVGSTIKVSGKLLYDGVGMKGETVTITVNGKKYTAVSGGYGYFTVNYTIGAYDDLNVTFNYHDASGYSITNSTVYTVKKPVELFMYSRSGDKVGSTIKVSGKLLYDGVGMKGETVTITVNGKKYTAVSGGYGYFTVNYTIGAYDDLNVTFTYGGSSRYLPVSNSTVYTIVKA